MNTKTSNTLRKAAQRINNISFVLSVILYVISFRLIKTRTLRERARAYKQKWEARKAETQRLLDEEHAKGQGVMFIDRRTKYYDPYTSATVNR